jgi:hypothetical protein
VAKSSNNPFVRLRDGVVLGVLLCGCITAPAAASEDPATDALWEMNLAAFGRFGPSYPASEETQRDFIPLPFPVYRGTFFRLGDDTESPMRGRVFRYEVTPAFATADRPAFTADGGYLGTEIALSLRWPVANRLELWGGIRQGFYTRATNEDSPLFTDDTTTTLYAAFMYRFWESRRWAVGD